VFDNIDALRWNGPRSEFETLCNQLKTPALFRRATVAGGDKRERHEA